MSFVNALRLSLSLPAWLYPAKQEASPPQKLVAPSRKLSRVLQGQGRLGCQVRTVSVHDYDSWMREDPNEFKLFVEEIGATQRESRENGDYTTSGNADSSALPG